MQLSSTCAAIEIERQRSNNLILIAEITVSLLGEIDFSTKDNRNPVKVMTTFVCLFSIPFEIQSRSPNNKIKTDKIYCRQRHTSKFAAETKQCVRKFVYAKRRRQTEETNRREEKNVKIQNL